MKHETAIPVGSGGMGEVFKAWNPDLERHVALKYLRHDDPVLVERLLREARAQARVDSEMAGFDADSKALRHYAVGCGHLALGEAAIGEQRRGIDPTAKVLRSLEMLDASAGGYPTWAAPHYLRAEARRLDSRAGTAGPPS